MQSVDLLYETKDFWEWGKYFPNEKHYLNFEANIVGAFFKIEDLINVFSKARSSLGLLEVENYGDLISVHDKNHIKFIHSYFIHDAIINYNIAIDLAWQVIFFYITDSSEYLLANHEEYRNHASRCNRTNLIELMKMYDETELKSIEDNFFNDNTIKEVRRIYNLYKHKSELHTSGLGNQYGKFIFDVKIAGSNVELNMLTREEIVIEEMKTTLVNFDSKFFDYFSEILNCIVPKDFEQKIDEPMIDMSTEGIMKLHSYAKKIQNYKKYEFNNYKRLFDIANNDLLEVGKKEKVRLI